MLVKLYGHDKRDTEATHSRTGHKLPCGPYTRQPEPKHISTSCVEHRNLTMHMSIAMFRTEHQHYLKESRAPYRGVAALLQLLYGL
jgi:hypothetical protein